MSDSVNRPFKFDPQWIHTKHFFFHLFLFLSGLTCNSELSWSSFEKSLLMLRQLEHSPGSLGSNSAMVGFWKLTSRKVIKEIAKTAHIAFENKCSFKQKRLYWEGLLPSTSWFNCKLSLQVIIFFLIIALIITSNKILRKKRGKIIKKGRNDLSNTFWS